MFPVGVILTLAGYAGLYVAVYRLGGDTRTVPGIIMGGNNGKPIRTTQSSSGSGSGSVAGTVGDLLTGNVKGIAGDVEQQANHGNAFTNGALGNLGGILKDVL